MKLLANPMMMRLALASLLMAGVLLALFLMLRRMRRQIHEGSQSPAAAMLPQAFELHAYTHVIQGLKQQNHELQAQQRQERRRNRVSERVSSIVFSHLPCGVLFFSTQGLVRQFNPAARQILGSESLAGLDANQLFRGAAARSWEERGAWPDAATALNEVLRRGTILRDLVLDYTTPAGEARVLSLTMAPVLGAGAEILGATCIVNDATGNTATGKTKAQATAARAATQQDS